MKTILLLRHAKAEPLGDHLRDFDRPLAPRGHEDALRVGRALERMEMVPDAIVTSPALRARETALDVAKAVGFKKGLREDIALYETPGPTWLAILAKLPASADLGLLVAHNPGIEELAGVLSGAPHGFVACPTAGILAFESPVTSWKGLGEHGAAMRWFLRPKLLEAITR